MEEFPECVHRMLPSIPIESDSVITALVVMELEHPIPTSVSKTLPCVEVLQLVEKAMPGAPGAGQVVVRWIASPVNPLDLNKISDMKVGPGVKGLAAGDKVISALLKYPVWANYKLCGADEVRKVDDRLSIVSVALKALNPLVWSSFHLRNCMVNEYWVH
uniref:Alcohol dehydrogenase N-terminal domain-containing protein n=1 Tax=Parascaris equorum TaxID=6256 RepID=A0A914S9V4_PAREQ